MKERTPLVAGIGEVLWDKLPEDKKPGGAPANCVYHLSRMGCEAYTVSSVGNDREGAELIDLLNTLGISTDYITVNQKNPTGMVTVRLDSDGNPEYTIHGNAAWDSILIDDHTKSLLQNCQAVCYGSLAQRSRDSREVINDLLKLSQTNCFRVFDINLRQDFYNREIIERSLELCNVLKINDEELFILGGLFNLSGNYIEMLQQLFDLYPVRLIALTRGSESSILYNGRHTSILNPPPVSVVDTVGAGDSFTAAIIAGLLRGLNMKEIHRIAVEVSAWVCTCSGATPDYDTLQINRYRLF